MRVKEEIVRIVEKALDAQFELYSWADMLSDCGLDDKELDWALQHLSYKVVME